MLLSNSACFSVWGSFNFFSFLYSTERLLAGQFCSHASTASRLPAACLPLAAFWFELPRLVTFQCKVRFSPPNFFPFPPPPLIPLPGAPFDLVLVKSCRTWPRAAVQVRSSRAERKLLWINLPVETGPEHPCDAKFCSCPAWYPTASQAGNNSTHLDPPRQGSDTLNTSERCGQRRWQRLCEGPLSEEKGCPGPDAAVEAGPQAPGDIFPVSRLIFSGSQSFLVVEKLHRGCANAESQ